MVSVPTWFIAALGEVGEKERAGDADNPRIVEYLDKATSVPDDMLEDETAWCSAFANWCMLAGGRRGTGRANARSWLQWGQPLATPRLGCIVVFSRPAAGPASGHVAFFVNEIGSQLHVLGGNQGNQVGIAPYPKARLLGYRWPTVADRP